jgi:hypothetical protein
VFVAAYVTKRELLSFFFKENLVIVFWL